MLKMKPAVVVTQKVFNRYLFMKARIKDVLNPHAWMSPSNALIYIENVKNALVKYDPQNGAVYEKNAADYSQRIKQLDEPLRAKLTNS